MFCELHCETKFLSSIQKQSRFLLFLCVPLNTAAWLVEASFSSFHTQSFQLENGVNAFLSVQKKCIYKENVGRAPYDDFTSNTCMFEEHVVNVLFWKCSIDGKLNYPLWRYGYSICPKTMIYNSSGYHICKIFYIKKYIYIYIYIYIFVCNYKKKT